MEVTLPESHLKRQSGDLQVEQEGRKKEKRSGERIIKSTQQPPQASSAKIITKSAELKYFSTGT